MVTDVEESLSHCRRDLRFTLLNYIFMMGGKNFLLIFILFPNQDYFFPLLLFSYQILHLYAHFSQFQIDPVCGVCFFFVHCAPDLILPLLLE